MPGPSRLRPPRQRALLLRGAIGGVLMGLANLVPGISGGTMLLATGIYPRFVSAVAELTTLRLRRDSVVLLAAVGMAAGSVIVLLAGPTRRLVIEHRWLMYSLFIGLTFGGVPILWRRVRRVTLPLALGTVAGLVAMVIMAMGSPVGASEAHSSGPALFGAGVAGAAAMVLPGVSGAYLLLVLGQYVAILAGIDAFKRGLLAPLAAGAPPDAELIVQALHVAIPVGLGVVLGIAAVSNLVRWTLERFPKPTLGVLLGLLLGAAIGLWPFQRSVAPSETSLSTQEEAEPGTRAPGAESWRVETFLPTPAQASVCVLLIAVGFGVTFVIGRLDEFEQT